MVKVPAVLLTVVRAASVPSEPLVAIVTALTELLLFVKLVTSVRAWAPTSTVPVLLFVKVEIGPARSPVRLKAPVFLTVGVFITPCTFIVAALVTEVEASMVSVLMKVPPELESEEA